MQLGLLGTDYANQVVTDRSIFARLAPPVPSLPLPRRGLVQSMPTFACSATPRSRVLAAGGTQAISIHVVDKAGVRSSANVDVALTVRFPAIVRAFSARTDANGDARLEFEVGFQPTGIIIAMDAAFTQNGARVCDPLKAYFLIC